MSSSQPKHGRLTEQAYEALSWMWASCERVSQSESESFDRDRSLWEVLSVNAHQFYCPGCRRFRKQMRSLTAVVRKLRVRNETSEKLPHLSLPLEARNRIQARLKGANGSEGTYRTGEPSSG